MLQIILVFGFLGGTVYFLNVEKILIAVDKLSPLNLFFAALLTVVGIFLQSVKWQIFLSHCQSVSSFSKSMNSVLLGMALGLFTPGRIGEIGRSLAFSSNRSITTVFAAVDRLISVLCGLMLSVLCVYQSKLVNVDHIFFGCIFFTIIFICIFFLKRFLVRRYSIVGKFFKQSELISRKEYFFIFLYSMSFNVIFCFQFFLLVGGFFDWDLQIVFFIPIIYTVKSFLPVTIGDLGVREGVAVLVFGQNGLDPEPAFNASLVIFLLNVLIPAISGWLWCGGRTISSELAEIKKGL